jgi:Transposase DDE domain
MPWRSAPRHSRCTPIALVPRSSTNRSSLPAWFSRRSSRPTTVASRPTCTTMPSCALRSACPPRRTSPPCRRRADACCAYPKPADYSPPRFAASSNAAARSSGWLSTRRGWTAVNAVPTTSAAATAPQKQYQTVAYSRFAKLESAFDCPSHLMVGVLVGRGPRPDVDRFRPLLDDCLLRVRLGDVLADAGYDSEPNHRYARQQHRVRSFIPASIGRRSPRPPSGRYRRRMRQRLDKHYGRYGQRWQAETGISMLKRRLTSTVNGRSYWSQCRELLLVAITYNIMLLYVTTGFLQSSPDTFSPQAIRGAIPGAEPPRAGAKYSSLSSGRSGMILTARWPLSFLDPRDGVSANQTDHP